GRLARARGEAVGRQAGDAILALRANDGSGQTVNAPPATQPGQWSPTPPKFGPPVGLNFAFVTPFAMTSPSQFRPAPPPALDIALADAGISCWETKNFYDFWRPVTAIRAGNSDGNPLTVADPTWSPLWATPAFSSYTSGHATFSAAASAVLGSFFGPHFAFTD